MILDYNCRKSIREFKKGFLIVEVEEIVKVILDYEKCRGDKKGFLDCKRRLGGLEKIFFNGYKSKYVGKDQFYCYRLHNIFCAQQFVSLISYRFLRYRVSHKLCI